ncbi:MAG: hypothetical protein ACYDHD_08370 [Vulcanimicrobiaceae bacterium]
MRVGLAIAAAFGIGALVERGLLAHAPARIVADLAQPLPVATTWHTFGLLTWLGLAATLALGFAAYALLQQHLLALPDERIGHRQVLSLTALCALAAAAGWAWPLLFSSDVYAYAAYGELARLGFSPYGHTLLPMQNPLFAAAVWQWGNPPPLCVYGPLFVALAKISLSLTAPLGLLAQLNSLRLLACAGLVACVPLAYAAFAGRRRSVRLAAAAAIGLNPVVLWSAVEGHNDALALAMVLAGVALARSRLPLLGAFTATLAALLKAPALVAGVGLAAASWANDRRRALAMLIGATFGIALVLMLSLPLLAGVRSAMLAAHAHPHPQASLAGLLGLPPALLIAGLIIVLGLAAALRRKRWGWALIGIGVWLAIPNPYPWYAIWVLPLAAISPRSLLARTLVALTALSVLRYVPDVVGPLSYANDVWLSALTLVPLAVAAIAITRQKRIA